MATEGIEDAMMVAVFGAIGYLVTDEVVTAIGADGTGSTLVELLPFVVAAVAIIGAFTSLRGSSRGRGR